jgi:hypothetical protein
VQPGARIGYRKFGDRKTGKWLARFRPTKLVTAPPTPLLESPMMSYTLGRATRIHSSCLIGGGKIVSTRFSRSAGICRCRRNVPEGGLDRLLRGVFGYLSHPRELLVADAVEFSTQGSLGRLLPGKILLLPHRKRLIVRKPHCTQTARSRRPEQSNFAAARLGRALSSER